MHSFIELVLRPYHAMRRQIDVKVLWPQCCCEAYGVGATVSVTCVGVQVVEPIDHARRAFAIHAMSDNAWRVLGADEICRRIDALPWRLPL